MRTNCQYNCLTQVKLSTNIAKVKSIWSSMVHFFSKLFQTDFVESSIKPEVFHFSSPSLSEPEILSLMEEPSQSEIKTAIFSFKPFKSPGPDGLHLMFFQKFQNEIKDPATKFIGDSFEGCSLPLGLNDTYVCLIPKTNSPDNLKLFRLISLCNSIYKILTKCIVNRVRPLMYKLISPLQTSFIPRRRVADNVFIVQEAVYKRRKKKGTKGFCATKLDLKKAFDKLEWSFIKEVLVHFKFQARLLD